MLPAKRGRSRQPRQPAGVNRGHPLGKLVVSQWTHGAGLYDSARNTQASATAITQAIGLYSGDAVTGASFNGSTSLISFGDSPALDFGTGLFSVEIIVNLASVGSQQSIFEKDDEGSNRQLFGAIQGAGQFRAGWSDNAGNFTLFDTTAIPAVGRNLHILWCRTASTSISVYFDGVLQAGSLILSSATTVGATAANAKVGQRDNANLPLSSGSTVSLVRVYGGDVSAWAAKLYKNPWQVFSDRPKWGPQEATAGGVSGDLARTTAADTSAAAGTTTIVGTLARTTANDASAASGTSTVVGAVSRTTGADISSAAGTTTVVGSLARTTGNDTAAASGSVGSAVSGSLAVTTGADTAAAVGTTVLVGSLARTTAGDTASLAGTTTVLGALASTTAGDTSSADTSASGAVVYLRLRTAPAATSPGRASSADVFLSLRPISGLWSEADVRASANRQGLRTWLPPSQVPIGYVNGDRDKPVMVDVQAWYKFLTYMTNTVLGGPNGSTLPDVVATVVSSAANSVSAAATVATVAQQTQANADSLAATVDVAKAAGLPGAESIPPVSLYTP